MSSLVLSRVSLSKFDRLLSDIPETVFIPSVRGCCNEYCVCTIYLYTKLLSSTACTAWRMVGGQMDSDVLSQHRPYSEQSVCHLYLRCSETFDTHSTFLQLITWKYFTVYCFNESLKYYRAGIVINHMLSIGV